MFREVSPTLMLDTSASAHRVATVPGPGSALPPFDDKRRDTGFTEAACSLAGPRFECLCGSLAELTVSVAERWNAGGIQESAEEGKTLWRTVSRQSEFSRKLLVLLRNASVGGQILPQRENRDPSMVNRLTQGGSRTNIRRRAEAAA